MSPARGLDRAVAARSPRRRSCWTCRSARQWSVSRRLILTAVPIISSAPVTINYRVRQNNKQTWLLTVIASGDLVSGPSTVDISAVSWVATPAPPFQNGTLSKTVARTVATGPGNQASPATGSLTFRLANSWTYDAGIYTQSIVFTLSTP